MSTMAHRAAGRPKSAEDSAADSADHPFELERVEPDDDAVPASGIRATLSEKIGVAVGMSWAPAFAAVSALRKARTFHPRGDLFAGHLEVDPNADAGDAGVASRLVGEVLVRFSDALSKQGPTSFDVLGCALRFGRGGPASEGDQDLVFATIRRPWTMPLAPLTTITRDYLANDYFAVSPFAIDHSEDRMYFRLHPELTAHYPDQDVTSEADSEARRQRVVDASEAGALSLLLDYAAGPWGPYRPLGRIVLDCELLEDPPNLSFDPFANGAGIAPRGFVNALRRGVYAASRFGRGAQ